MGSKEQDKRELQAAKDEFRALVNSAALDEATKWTRIHERIRQFRLDAAASLKDESYGVVAHDRRAKLAAFACEYATVYYEKRQRAGLAGEEQDECELRLGDLARMLAGIKSVPRAPPALTPRETAQREHYMQVAVRHYDAMRGNLVQYRDRITRLTEEQEPGNALLPFLFLTRKVLTDDASSVREKSAALAEALALKPGSMYADFACFGYEVIVAATAHSPLQMSHAAFNDILNRWSPKGHTNMPIEKRVTVIVAVALVGTYAKGAVPGVLHCCQRLVRTPRLLQTLKDTFVEKKEPLTEAPLLKHFIDSTQLDGLPLSKKVSTLSSYPNHF